MPKSHSRPDYSVKRETWKGKRPGYYSVARDISGAFLSTGKWHSVESTKKIKKVAKKNVLKVRFTSYKSQFTYVVSSKIGSSFRTLTISSTKKYNGKSESFKKQLYHAIAKKYKILDSPEAMKIVKMKLLSIYDGVNIIKTEVSNAYQSLS